ncbi:putative GPI-anchored protein pfl2 [Pecten maximus]|uniref:putative GPI-anchored protein pfl2 n=1 Tax=Pecten maximus TaxID=6579 RepID=UPI001458EC50|nr:putative GPI-anchored protein pfl2 [Pecten maximus]
MKNIVWGVYVILSLFYLAKARHLGESQQTTTQINRINSPRRSTTTNLRGSPTSSRSQSMLSRNILNPSRGLDQSKISNRINRPNRSNLRTAQQINPSPRRVRMNTQSLQGQKSVTIRQPSGRPLVQNPQRGSHIIPPSVSIQRNQGRQLSRSNAVASRNNLAQVISNRNVRISNGRNTQNGIGVARGQRARGNSQQAALLERGHMSSQLQSNLGRPIQTNRFPSNTVTARVARRQGSVVRGSSNMISPVRNTGSIRSNGMMQGQNRGEFKQGATNQIRIRTQTDNSKLPFNDFNRNAPIIRENTGRGMWKSVPVDPATVPLEQLKSQSRPVQSQSSIILNSQPLVSQGHATLNLANSKNRMSSVQTAQNVIATNIASSVVGSPSAGVLATNGVQSGVTQGANDANGMIALELNLGAANTKQANVIQSVQPSTEIAAAGSANVATSGLKIPSNSPSQVLSTNKAPVHSLQIQKVHSGLTSGGKKKMSLTLSSGQSGGQPIVIEALGNIILSQEKLPDGRVQFVIKADGPTTGATVKATTKTTKPTTPATTATTTVTMAPTTTTTAMPTPTSTIPTSTIFMEETEMPEPGEFIYPPSGLGTTEPM